LEGIRIANNMVKVNTTTAGFGADSPIRTVDDWLSHSLLKPQAEQGSTRA